MFASVTLKWNPFNRNKFLIRTTIVRHAIQSNAPQFSFNRNAFLPIEIRHRRWLPLLIAGLATIGPFTIDTYLPSFPAIAAEIRGNG